MLRVRMFGALLISDDAEPGVEIGGSKYRRSRVWNVLAYLLHYHERMLPWEELVGLLDAEGRMEDPRGALRTILWRTRVSLEPLGQEMARAAIVTKDGAYGWNPALKFWLDTEAFEASCGEGKGAEDELGRIRCCRQAVQMFQGAFLDKLGGEAWVDQLAEYYNRLYLDAALRVLPHLKDSGEERDLSSICDMALRIAPYDERFCRILMESRIRRGDYQGAEDVYQAMRKRLWKDLGMEPDRETQALHRELNYYADSRYVLPQDIGSKLREQEAATGALLCEYPLFQLIYRMWLCNAGRWKDAVHIAVLSVEGREGQMLSLQNLKQSMDRLRKVLSETLRAQDVASNCSAAQYVILQSQISAENSGKACQRVIRRFAQRYPDASVRITFDIVL